MRDIHSTDDGWSNSPPQRWGGEQFPDPDGTRPAGYYLRFVLGLLRRHLLLVLLITAATAGLMALKMRGETASYRATAVVRITDARGALTGVLDPTSVAAPLGKVDLLQAELEIFRSRRVIGEAVDAMGFRLSPRNAPFLAEVLTEKHVGPNAPADSIVLAFGPRSVSAEAGGRRTTAAYGAPIEIDDVRFVVRAAPAQVDSAVLDILPRDRAISILLRWLETIPRGSTDIVDVRYTADHPLVAQQVVNSVVTAFQTIDAERAQQEARRRREFLAEQVVQNDSIFAAAQLSLSAFESRARAGAAPDRMSARQEAVASLEIRQQELEAQQVVYRSLFARLQQSSGEQRRRELSVVMSSPGVSASPVVASLYQRLVQYEAARDTSMSGSTAATNPAIERLDRLIASTEAQLVDAIRSQLTSLESQIGVLASIRRQTETDIAAGSVPAQAEADAVQLQQRVETIRKLADLVREEYQRARIAEAVEAGQVEVVDLALPGAPIPTNRTRNLIFSVVIGLVLGVGGAYVRETLDNSIRGGEELESTVQLPILTTVPRLSAEAARRRALGRNGDRTRLAAGKAASAALANPAGVEAYRMLSAILALPNGERPLRTVIVTSALPQEGKSTTSANLAIAEASAGQRVLLIDADVSRPTLHVAFGVDPAPGLVEVLKRQVSISEAVQSTSVEGLSLLTAGAIDSNSPNLCSRESMRALLDFLSDKYDRIVLDSPPVLLAANAVVLASVADGVVLVVRAGKTDRTAIQQAVQKLAIAKARVIGTVFNDSDGRASRYGYGYGYGYSGHYGSYTPRA
jgi:polysaccharide biosynthesis transport protein